MKAIRFHAQGEPGVLRLDDISVPVSQPGEALVRVRTAGANYADIYQRTGVTPLTI
jgi:NADPH2:quinone reductase